MKTLVEFVYVAQHTLYLDVEELGILKDAMEFYFTTCVDLSPMDKLFVRQFLDEYK